MLFHNGPEYEERLKKPFVPIQVTLKEIHDAVPKHLFIKDSVRSTLYILRDACFSLFLYKFALSITPWVESDFGGFVTGSWEKWMIKSAMWVVYWCFQGLIMAGMFCLGHELGHGGLYNSKWANNFAGFLVHQYIFIPYFSWQVTHHNHHKATASMEREETYAPYVRSDFSLPEEKVATNFDYAEILEETPICTMYRMFIMQVFGWWMYLTQNTMGSKMYPPGSNHFRPSSALFKPQHRNSVIMSNLGILGMVGILAYLGWDFFVKCYLVPFITVNHWIVMITYLQHSDPSIPYYRRSEWTFLRGALSTIDRPLLGWMGRFFLHNVCHDHVSHHLFLRAPFYKLPKITAAVKPVLKEYYNFDSTPTFYALYRNFTQCIFVEDEGDVVFYKDRKGKAKRRLDENYARVIGITKMD